MSEYKYKFTIFTPCYNSSKFIHRVFETLNSQTFRDFEWIVVNDASTDNTAELISEYIKTVKFPVKFFDLKQNQMLAANYNLAFENTEGEIFVVTGHDDIYMPDMLEEYARLYDKYNGSNIGGLVGRCETQYGKVTPKEFTKNIMNYWEYGVDANGHYTGEAPRALKTEAMAKYMPFDPKEKLNPTIEALMGCDGLDFITTNKIVRKYFVQENSGALTVNIGKYPYYQWKCALLEINKFQFYKKTSPKQKIKNVLMYVYACSKVEYNFFFNIKEIKHSRCLVSILYPIGYILKLISNNKLLHDLVLRKHI